MKNALLLALTLAACGSTAAGAYQCNFQSGEVVQTQLPCEPAMVERFGNRVKELYPEVQQINTSPDYMMGLYTFAMNSCLEHFAMMTPAGIGANGEPFFPKKMRAAMVTAGREIICPAVRHP